MASVLQVATIKDQGGNANAIEIANSSANVTINNLTSSTGFPAGHVIQTVQRKKSDEGSSVITSGSYQKVVDTGGNAEWYGAITPGSGNKVLINFNFVTFIVQSDAADGAGFCIYRENTIIHQHVNGHSQYHGSVSSSHNFYTGVHLQFLDETPGGDGSTEIKYYLGNRVNENSSVRINSDGSQHQPFISILQEIKG